LNNSNQEPLIDPNKTYKPLIWIAIVSIIMLFGGLTSAYIVTKADNFWVQFDMPMVFFLSTSLIILSSISFNMALKAAKQSDYKMVKLQLAVTLFLGLGFVYSQYSGWSELVEGGHFFVGDITQIEGEYGNDYTIEYSGQPLVFNDGTFYMPGDEAMAEPIDEDMLSTFHTSSSFLYVLTGLHVAHLLGGIIALMVVLGNALKEKYNAKNSLGLEVCSIYWHFLDVLWVYLFLFLFFIR